MSPRQFAGSAERLAALVDSSDDVIIGKDVNGMIVSWNGAAHRLLYYTAAEAIGRSIRLIIPERLWAQEDLARRRALAGEHIPRYDTQRQRKDGSIVHVTATVSAICTGAGDVLGTSEISRDITEPREAETDRSRLLALAQESNRLKDEFLTTLSHELRTPLNAIVGYTRMIQSGLLAGVQQVRGLDTIERNTRALTQLVEDLLDLSRVVSGHMRLKVEPVDLSAIIGDAGDSLQPACDAKGVQMETTLDGDVGRVAGDQARLRQVVWNVLSNAVKFTNRGGQVQVRLQRTNGQADVTVVDTGIGIAPAFLPHLFERFRQADASSTRERGGLGLGLAIARHLVELHGGTIEAWSDGNGRGSTFLIRLPLMRDDSATSPDELSAGVEVYQVQPQVQKRRHGPA